MSERDKITDVGHLIELAERIDSRLDNLEVNVDAGSITGNEYEIVVIGSDGKPTTITLEELYVRLVYGWRFPNQ